jgi:protein-S-isoprenylcysteine O-methyltransferase Ste14
MQGYNWTQVCCLHLLIFYLLKLSFLIWYNIRESKNYQRTEPKNQKEEIVDHFGQKFILAFLTTSMVFSCFLTHFGYLEFSRVFEIDDMVASIGHIVTILATVLMVWTHWELGNSWPAVVSEQNNQKLTLCIRPISNVCCWILTADWYLVND